MKLSALAARPSHGARWRQPDAPISVALLDRDGVINVNRDRYVRSWADFEFLPRAVDGLGLLHRAGIRVAVVTNQSAVNRGVTTMTAVEECHRRMSEAVAAGGGLIERVFVCPHRPDEACSCRKPAPGLLLRAVEELGVSIADAVLVGDHLTDLEAAERAGCASMLTLTGRAAAVDGSDLPPGCVGVVPDLLSAAQHLCGQASELAGVEP